MSMTESEAKRFADAHHDCKLVADGIVDDETFQKADSGLVLGYMREILEALEEIQQYRAIGTVKGYERAIQISIENYNLCREYKAKVQEFEAIGTVSEFRELKEINEKITEAVNGQLIAGKNNYKEVYECFHKIADIVQGRIDWNKGKE